MPCHFNKATLYTTFSQCHCAWKRSSQAWHLGSQLASQLNEHPRLLRATLSFLSDSVRMSSHSPLSVAGTRLGELAPTAGPGCPAFPHHAPPGLLYSTSLVPVHKHAHRPMSTLTLENEFMDSICFPWERNEQMSQKGRLV